MQFMLGKELSRLFLLASLAIILSGCGNMVLYAKRDMDITQEKEDHKICWKFARDGKYPRANLPPNYDPTSHGLAGAAAVGIASGFAEGAARARRENRIMKQCMTDRGYTEVILNREEFDKLRNSKADEEYRAYALELLEKSLAKQNQQSAP